jgi:hypothetical protein
MVASDDACETKTRLDKSALPSSQTAFARNNLEPGNGALHRNSQKFVFYAIPFLILQHGARHTDHSVWTRTRRLDPLLGNQPSFPCSDVVEP